MENKKLTNCNQCPNHCPADALQCGRGRHYFEQLENPDKGKAEERGQNEHGEDQLFAVLDDEEKECLKWHKAVSALKRRWVMNEKQFAK